MNMYLEIKGIRPDGYHEIETLYRGINLHDTLILRKRKGGIRLDCGGIGLRGLPERFNLAWRAADLLSRAYPGKIKGAGMRLIKRIPASAGLGGGSADAAAALIGLDRLYSLDLDTDALQSLAAQLGADVPFCLDPLAAVGRGKGEALEPLEAAESEFPLWIVLLKPPFGLPTREVYGKWRPRAAAAGGERLGLLRRGMREKDAGLVRENMINDLEAPAFALKGELVEYRGLIEEEMEKLTIRRSRDKPGAAEGKVLLSGSGSAFAAYFTEEGLARELAEGLKANRRLPGESMIILTKTLTGEDLAQRVTGESRADQLS